MFTMSKVCAQSLKYQNPQINMIHPSPPVALSLEEETGTQAAVRFDKPLARCDQIRVTGQESRDRERQLSRGEDAF